MSAQPIASASVAARRLGPRPVSQIAPVHDFVDDRVSTQDSVEQATLDAHTRVAEPALAKSVASKVELPAAWREPSTVKISKAKTNPNAQTDLIGFFWGMLLMARELATAPARDMHWLWEHRAIITRAVFSLCIPLVAAYFMVASANHLSPTHKILGYVVCACFAFLATGWVLAFIGHCVRGARLFVRETSLRGRQFLNGTEN